MCALQVVRPTTMTQHNEIMLGEAQRLRSTCSFSAGRMEVSARMALFRR